MQIIYNPFVALVLIFGFTVYTEPKKITVPHDSANAATAGMLV